MRRRATRPNVFRGLKRFGVYSTDWKFILIPTAIAYIVPFVFGLWVGYVPLGFPLGLLVFLILLGIFNYLRLSKPSYWLSQKFDAEIDRWTDVSTAAPRRTRTDKLEDIEKEISMDTANLTFAQIAISLFGGLLSVGLGLVAGFRFIPAVRSLSSRTLLDRGSRELNSSRMQKQVGYFRPRSRG